MKKYNQSSGSSIFLMEIILNILLFSVLLTTSLQIIMKARQLTSRTTELHQAVSICSNIATCFESGDGTLAMIQNYYPHSMRTGDLLLLYFDDNFAACSKEDSAYYAVVNYINADTGRRKEVTISFFCDSDVIYTVKASFYEPLSMYSKTGGT